MSTYSTNSDKGTGSTELTNWYDCGAYEVGQNSGNSPDNLNGSLSLSKQDREAIGIDQGDEVLLKVEANGKTVITERSVVGGGRQVTLPVSERRKLDLSAGDNLEYSIIPISAESQNESEADDEDGNESRSMSMESETNETRDIKNSDTQEKNQNDDKSADAQNQQQTLDANGNDDSENQYVLIKDNDHNPWTYHIVRSESSHETVCSTDYSDKEHRILPDPSGFELCPLCTTHDLEEMENNQKLRWLGRKTGFEVDQEAAYMKGFQYDAVIKYIQELEDRSPGSD